MCTLEHITMSSRSGCSAFHNYTDHNIINLCSKSLQNTLLCHAFDIFSQINSKTATMSYHLGYVTKSTQLFHFYFFHWVLEGGAPVERCRGRWSFRLGLWFHMNLFSTRDSSGPGSACAVRILMRVKDEAAEHSSQNGAQEWKQGKDPEVFLVAPAPVVHRFPPAPLGDDVRAERTGLLHPRGQSWS